MAPMVLARPAARSRSGADAQVHLVARARALHNFYEELKRLLKNLQPESYNIFQVSNYFLRKVSCKKSVVNFDQMSYVTEAHEWIERCRNNWKRGTQNQDATWMMSSTTNSEENMTNKKYFCVHVRTKPIAATEAVKPILGSPSSLVFGRIEAERYE